ncbi:MAG: amino acid adenylation domain-containing protein [Pseudomonadota bacterium]
MRYLLNHLLDHSADAHSEREAIKCRAESLSFSELIEKANALAHCLREAGVKRGDRVGIFMNKGVGSAVALHGIMRAGAAYVPLDPAAPLERLRFVIHDCNIRVLVSEQRKLRTLEKLAACTDVEYVVGVAKDDLAKTVTVPWEELERESEAPRIKLMEQDICYILYTSGSTGVPKGIVHTHRSALAWADVSASAYSLSFEDRISNYAPLHFDLSTLDFFAGALSGATTVMIPEEYARLPVSLCELISSERLTLFYTVPLALTQLVNSGAITKNDFSHLKWVLFGGEPMPPKYLKGMMDLLPNTQFVNVYGPTETNGCTHYLVSNELDVERPVSIGDVYPNVESLVVDLDDEAVEPGEVGELLIRAPTRMQGYWGRNDLNESSTFYRELAPGVLATFHRTGDLVRQQTDGNFEFVGRKDRQIKSRGCRVELDEVEAVLLSHTEVREAAIFAVPDDTGHLSIHGCVIPQTHQLSDVVLSRHMKSHLPAYAVPVALNIVDDFPRTSTGKIDRLALQNHARGV